MNRIQLCSGLLLRGTRLLLVRTKYPDQAQPLWTLPGGRQEPDETIAQSLVREFREETGLRVRATALAYVSESIDPECATHVVNYTFWVEETNPKLDPRADDPAVAEVRFVESTEAPDLLRADVLRIPVTAALAGDDNARYFAFRHDEIRVPFFTQPASVRS